MDRCATTPSPREWNRPCWTISRLASSHSGGRGRSTVGPLPLDVTSILEVIGPHALGGHRHAHVPDRAVALGGGRPLDVAHPARRVPRRTALRPSADVVALLAARALDAAREARSTRRARAAPVPAQADALRIPAHRKGPRSLPGDHRAAWLGRS